MKNPNLFLILLPGFILMAGCKKNDVKKVKAAFLISTTNPAINEMVDFTNQSENAKYYQWEFGDGNISVDENPSHIYTSSGIFQVVLKAIGNDGSDTVSSILKVKVPADLITIHEGLGIDKVSLANATWKSMRDTFPEIDTLYFTSFLTDYSLYLNQVYFESIGVVGVFFSDTKTVADTDPLIGLILYPPYPGYTNKNVSVGSSMISVKLAYGVPEAIDETTGYLGYSYASKGIDFYAYKDINVDYVTEIDIYPVQTKAAVKKGTYPGFRKIRTHAANSLLHNDMLWKE